MSLTDKPGRSTPLSVAKKNAAVHITKFLGIGIRGIGRVGEKRAIILADHIVNLFSDHKNVGALMLWAERAFRHMQNARGILNHQPKPAPRDAIVLSDRVCIVRSETNLTGPHFGDKEHKIVISAVDDIPTMLGNTEPVRWKVPADMETIRSVQDKLYEQPPRAGRLVLEFDPK